MQETRPVPQFGQFGVGLDKLRRLNCTIDMILAVAPWSTPSLEGMGYLHCSGRAISSISDQDGSRCRPQTLSPSPDLSPAESASCGRGVG